MRHNKLVTFGLVLTLSGFGCSVVMEATRPDPVDTSQIAVGESRMQVIGIVGAPAAQGVKDGNTSCDIYKLYTRGPNDIGKGAIATGEAVADFFTLGLTEIVFTPVEGATRNAKHTVTFCYDQNEKLVTMNDGGVSGQ